jgi:hypothetical protein
MFLLPQRGHSDPTEIKRFYPIFHTVPLTGSFWMEFSTLPLASRSRRALRTVLYLIVEESPLVMAGLFKKR